VTAAEQTLPERIETVLPPAHSGVRREAVLDEMQRAAGLEETPHLAQRCGDVGNGAHRSRPERSVEAVIRKRKRLGVRGGAVHWAHRQPACRRAASAGSTAVTCVTAAG
jgi:hypothetical protein